MSLNSFLRSTIRRHPTGRATMRDPAIDPPFFISMTNSGRSRRRRSQTLKPLESGRARSSPRSLQRGRFGGRSRNIRTTSSVIPTGTRAISFDRPGRLPAKQINPALIRSYLLRVSDIRYRVGFVRLLRASWMKALKEVCSSQNVVASNGGHIAGLRLLVKVAVDVVRDFVAVRLEREMSGGEHIRFKILQILLVGLGTRWREDEIL